MEKCIFSSWARLPKLARNISETFSVSKLVVLVISNKFYSHFFKVVQIFFNGYCRHDRESIKIEICQKNTTTTTLLDTNGWYVKGKGSR